MTKEEEFVDDKYGHEWNMMKIKKEEVKEEEEEEKEGREKLETENVSIKGV